MDLYKLGKNNKLKISLIALCVTIISGCSSLDDEGSFNLICSDSIRKMAIKFEDKKYQGAYDCQIWNDKTIECKERVTVLSTVNIDVKYDRTSKRITIAGDEYFEGVCAVKGIDWNNPDGSTVKRLLIMAFKFFREVLHK